jgi:putative NADH-flavin reductase
MTYHSTKPRITLDTPAGPQISYEDVAEFMIANANLTGSQYNKKRVGIATLLF